MESRLMVALVARVGFMTLLFVAILVGFLQWGTPLGVVAFILAALFFLLYVVVRLKSRALVRRISASGAGGRRAGPGHP